MRYFQRNSIAAAEAEDLLHETYARLCSVEDPQTLENPRAFLYALARNVLIDSKRRERVRADFVVREVEDLDATSGTPEFEASRAQDLAALRQAIEALPTLCRQVLILHRFRGMSHREIADHLGLSLAAVEKHMVRALKRCQETLARRKDVR